ncbi:MAG: acyl carrier protein [Candidatus Omnitrophica bacterium]|nr:acyl carrier protein [Candidatus Omnitrophota bacterium]
MAVETTLNRIFNKVLDLSPEDIVKDEPLDQAHEVDSTEMVEISVGLKKELKIDIGDNELKKTHSYKDIVGILKAKGIA